MSKVLTRWIIAAAFTAAFFYLCAVLDGNDQQVGYPITMAAATSGVH